MKRNRAKKIGTKIRVVTHDLDGFNGMRPFHTKRFGEIIGHNATGRQINSYIINMDDGTQLVLIRTQFATSALNKSYRYESKKK